MTYIDQEALDRFLTEMENVDERVIADFHDLSGWARFRLFWGGPVNIDRWFSDRKNTLVEEILEEILNKLKLERDGDLNE